MVLSIISLRLLALILCSNCSNTFNKVLTSTWRHTVKLLFATLGRHFSLLNMLHGWSKHFTSRYDPSTPFLPYPHQHHIPATALAWGRHLSVAWHVQVKEVKLKLQYDIYALYFCSVSGIFILEWTIQSYCISCKVNGSWCDDTPCRPKRHPYITQDGLWWSYPLFLPHRYEYEPMMGLTPLAPYWLL